MSCAYVTLVMLGDGYVDAALVLAKSLLMSKTKKALVCMVTADVTANAIVKLSKYYIIEHVPYITFQCGPMKTKRQNEIYCKWIHHSFTKWNCLKLKYRKIIYMDADQVVLKNIDGLFKCKTPCMSFDSEYSNSFIKTSRLQNPFIAYRHGMKIPFNMLVRAYRENALLGSSGVVVLKPCLRLMSTIVGLLRKENKTLTQPSRFNNGHDEQVFYQAMLKLRYNAFQMDRMYTWAAGTYWTFNAERRPYVINYFGTDKPWMIKDGDSIPHMDMYPWHYFKKLVDQDF